MLGLDLIDLVLYCIFYFDGDVRLMESLYCASFSRSELDVHDKRQGCIARV